MLQKKTQRVKNTQIYKMEGLVSMEAISFLYKKINGMLQNTYLHHVCIYTKSL